MPTNHSKLGLNDVLTLVFELSNDGIVLARKNIVIAANHRFAAICGYESQALPGMTIQQLIPALYDSDINSRTGQQPDNLDNRCNLDLAVQTLNGKLLPVKVSCGQIVDAGKTADLIFVSELCPRPSTAEELRKARQMESIAALSGGIAHDYNNLLTAIIGNISMVQSYLDQDDIIFRLLQEAHEASQVAKALTQKLITFSRGGAPVKETSDIAGLVKSATEFTLSGSNIKSQYHLSKDLFLVDIDKTQMGQAIYNLVMNARESMPDGGILAVTAENIQTAAGATDLKPGRYIRLSFSDQGVGIPPQNLDKIFDPYFSTKERGTQKGMGLGLSICHSIITQHNGRMQIESAVGTGSTVHIYLPASDDKLPESAPPDQDTPAEPVMGSGRILVMDDEERIIRLATLILARLGYEADFARHGDEALSMYAKAMASGRPFDAVILDLTVRGGMGGEETMQKLLEMDPAVKGIVSSGYSDSPVMTDHLKYGFKDVIIKPYSLFEMSDKLARVIDG